MSTVPPLRPRKAWLYAAAATILLKLWFVAAQPLIASGQSGHDDRLYLHLSNYLLNGEWLGSYSQFTLMKGPMYSLWITATFLLGVPLPIAQHLLYLSGCILVVVALRDVFRSAWQPFVLFALLWWNPMTYELPVLGRVLRQNFYTPATLLLFAAMIALHTRRDATRGTRLAWGLLLGGSSAALWLTREESIWVAPSLSVFVLTAAWKSWQARRTLRPLMVPLATATVLAAGVVLTVCTLNYRYYGWFGTVEFRAPEFRAAYGALQRVRPMREIRYVPVTKEARMQIYQVSPTFAELKPYLEGDGGRAWAAASVSVTGSSGEIGGGWFMWALRDAVIATGHVKSAAEALKFYGRMADEINRACDEGRLNAAPRRDSLVPRWTQGHWTRLKREFPVYLSAFLFFQDFTAVPIPSSGEGWMLQLFRDLCRWPVSIAPEATVLELPTQNRIDAWRIHALDAFGRAMCGLNAAIAVTGLVAWIWIAWHALQTRRLSLFFIVATASFLACGAVFSINLLVHIMSFYNRSPGAFAQAYPLLLLGSCITWFQVLESLCNGRPPRAPASATG